MRKGRGTTWFFLLSLLYKQREIASLKMAKHLRISLEHLAIFLQIYSTDFSSNIRFSFSSILSLIIFYISKLLYCLKIILWLPIRDRIFPLKAYGKSIVFDIAIKVILLRSQFCHSNKVQRTYISFVNKQSISSMMMILNEDSLTCS